MSLPRPLVATNALLAELTFSLLGLPDDCPTDAFGAYALARMTQEWWRAIAVACYSIPGQASAATQNTQPEARGCGQHASLPQSSQGQLLQVLPGV